MKEIEYGMNSVSNFRIGGFATGTYNCICSVCKKEYIGDKRSTDGENVQQGFISEVSLSDD